MKKLSVTTFSIFTLLSTFLLSGPSVANATTVPPAQQATSAQVEETDVQFYFISNQQAFDAAESAGINVKTILRFGSPKVEIAKNIPKEHHIDLILLGATGLNAVERILIGSVSEYVVRNAPCDVLIVRAHEEEAEDHERITNDDF